MSLPYENNLEPKYNLSTTEIVGAMYERIEAIDKELSEEYKDGETCWAANLESEKEKLENAITELEGEEECKFCQTYGYNKFDYTKIDVVMQISDYNKRDYGNEIPRKKYVYSYDLNFCPVCGKKIENAGKYTIKE